MSAVSAAPAARPPARIRAALPVRVIANEASKGLLVAWSHKGTLVPQVVLAMVMYLMVQLVLGDGHIVHALLPLTLFSFLAYFMVYMAMMNMVSSLLEEANAGTLEQGLLGPLRPWTLSAGRLIAAVGEGVLTSLVAAAILVPTLRIEVPDRPGALVPIGLTLLDIAGTALLMGALGLVVNSIGAIVHVIGSMFMILNGGMVPISAFPDWLAAIARMLPTTLGAGATREVLFGHVSLSGAWADHSLQWAALHAAFMLALGAVAFRAAIRRGLREGRLGP
jgi:ABC-2 type transport system permease protein